jgi:glycerol-3-phosphate acyltransferase PlsY
VAIAGYPGPEVSTVVVLAALIVLRHRDNLSRLARGEERSLPSGRDRP